MKLTEMVRSERERCSGCTACANVCPVGAIAMVRDEEGFRYPEIDRERCSGCRACERICPGLNIILAGKTEPRAFAYMGSDEVRAVSSSGGAFTGLAEQVLARGGVVFGAAFDSRWQVRHIAVESLAELAKLRGSKYLQSDIGRVYREVRAALRADRYVLFSGTPCQIEGLYSYLGRRSYQRLLLVDLICHGVPSPAVWAKYLATGDNTEIYSINFRNKNLSWERYLLDITYSDSNKYLGALDHDLYMSGFLQDIILRPSCYRCGAKKLARVSDITIADFWGINAVRPDFSDHRGTSLVIVHSEVGAQAFAALPGRSVQVDLTAALRRNPSMTSSVSDNPKRKVFFRRFIADPGSVRQILAELTYVPLWRRAARRLRQILGGVKRRVKRYI